jgi:glycosyltransferase involved in cell wall biosynthesis
MDDPNHPTPLDLTVVIPAHNSAATLRQQLAALLVQEWSGTWEVVVVDNRSHDATVDLVREYSVRSSRVRLVEAPDRASIGYARNVGIDHARGAAIVMCDADDVVKFGWLRAIGDSLRDHEFVTGPIDVHALNPSWVVETRGKKIEDGPGQFLGIFPFAHSCNLGFRRTAFDRVGRFDETLVNGSDVEFSYRLWKVGTELTYVDDAVVCYRYRDTMTGLYKQARNYARVKAPLAARFRAQGTPMTLPSDGRYLVWLVRRLAILRTRSGRARWIWVLGTTVGGFEGRRRSRVLAEVRPPTGLESRAG